MEGQTEDPNGDAIEGVLFIDPVSMGKRFQGTWIRTDDGKDYLLGYRPVERFLEFQRRRVVATGEHWWPEPYAQYVDAAHFRAAEVRLAEGEERHGTAPERVLPPPFAENRDGFEQVIRWVAVVGDVSDVSDRGSGRWFDGTLTLSDGTVVQLAGLRKEDVGEGTRTFVGSVSNRDPLTLGVARSCEGRVPECGLDLEIGSKAR